MFYKCFTVRGLDLDSVCVSCLRAVRLIWNHARWLRSVLWELLNCASLSAVPTGGGLHRLHAQPKGTWSGKGCQEEGGTLRRVHREGALHCTVCHCTVTLDPTKGPISTDVGDLVTSMKGYFLYHGNHVCNNANRVPTVRPTTWDFFHGYTDGQKIHRQNTVIPLFFCPNTVTAYDKSYTLYCIYAILTPLSPVRGLRDLLTPMVVGFISSRWRLHWPLIRRGRIPVLSTLPHLWERRVVIIDVHLLVPIFLYKIVTSQAENHSEYWSVIPIHQTEDNYIRIVKCEVLL